MSVTMATLVTGVSGFVGSAIAQALLADGQSFAILVRNSPPACLLPAIRDGQVTVLEAELANYRSSSWSVVIHAAAWALKGARTELDLPAPAFQTNVTDSLAFLERAVSEAGRLILLSTIDVYGSGPIGRPIDETHPLNPQTYYAVSKAAQEISAGILCARRGATLTVLRLAQVYGPGDSSEKVIPALARHVTEGKPPILWSQGRSRRSWVYITDVVATVLAVLRKPTGGTYNVAGPQSTTVADVARILCRLDGRGLEPILSQEGRVTDTIIGNEAVINAFGYRPSVTLADGLASYWRWLQGRR